MNGRKCDIAIVGGGLSGGLIAAALAAHRPDLSICLIDGYEMLGGNHRWSWFDSDLSAQGRALLAPFEKIAWNDGYDVAFPGHRRTLATPYRSLASADFDAALRRILPEEAIHTGRQAITIDAGGAILGSGERIEARSVVDCRGPVSSIHLQGGWQVFLGRHLHLAGPHGVERPMIMDATVAQHGAYRFVYLLPLSERDLFIEDTYYADSPELDRAALTGRIDAYCTEHGWEGEWRGSETGVLPVITGGDFDAYQVEQRIEGVACAGVRGGFVHPLTSYTLPQAVETALAVAGNADLAGAELAALLEERAQRHWRATRFYRLLGQMLFGAAEPEQRWRIFQRFYALPVELIERFYAAKSTRFDQARILVGRPPVPIGRAISALVHSSMAKTGRNAA
jgi:lycopene beta-cyclase